MVSSLLGENREASDAERSDHLQELGRSLLLTSKPGYWRPGSLFHHQPIVKSLSSDLI